MLFGVVIPEAKQIKKIPSKGIETQNGGVSLLSDSPLEILELIIGSLSILDLATFLRLSRGMKVLPSSTVLIKVCIQHYTLRQSAESHFEV
jgi:hypothetical protein